ncbi:glutathione S-transferase family protein [Thalassotalea euphylliae]|uniref:glutathione S-transferase family protein n=1 Tax=Thalassotalea euphylliae TaxID=1655234 RepID=UPI003642BEC5
MKLLGSTTSPYVRRIRLLCELLNKPIEFDNLDIFSEQGREILREKNPTLKVPALIDGEQCIFDSRVISRYLMKEGELRSLSWDEENLMTLIDAANDSLVSLLISSRSGLDTQSDTLFFNLQRERVTEVYQTLEKSVTNGAFEQWHYPAICLYTLLDWANFRELASTETYPGLSDFLEAHQGRPDVIDTDPRQ